MGPVWLGFELRSDCAIDRLVALTVVKRIKGVNSKLFPTRTAACEASRSCCEAIELILIELRY